MGARREIIMARAKRGVGAPLSAAARHQDAPREAEARRRSRLTFDR